MDKQADVIQYQTSGTCCQVMQVAIKDGIILDTEFYGGCHGNLQGIQSLVRGMSVDDVIAKLQGIKWIYRVGNNGYKEWLYQDSGKYGAERII